MQEVRLLTWTVSHVSASQSALDVYTCTQNRQSDREVQSLMVTVNE